MSSGKTQSNDNPQVLNLIVDTSGSMIEGGKRLIARGIARQVEQFIRLGYATAEIRLFSAGDSAASVDWNPDTEYPDSLLTCSGLLNMSLLLDVLKDSKGKYLFLSDCSWDSRTKRAFMTWLGAMPEDSVRIIQIGNEHKTSVLGCRLFVPEDFFVAMDHWLEVS